jgi:erythrocyte band 7 integral membrane protein
LCYVSEKIDIYQKIDMRTDSYDSSTKGVKSNAENSPLVLQILTKDSVTVFVNASMYYRVKDTICAVSEVNDFTGSAILLWDILAEPEPVPEQLMRAMAAEAEAAREANAKVVAAEGELKASRALNHAVNVITDYPAALQVSIIKIFTNMY